MRISPLLLENVALRMGNLQVAKTIRSGGSCVIGLWYVTGWELVIVFSFLYVSNFEACCWSFILKNKCWNITFVGAFMPDLYVVGCNVLKDFSVAILCCWRCWINSIFNLFMKFLKSSVMLRLLIYSDFILIISCWFNGVLHSRQ